MVHAHDFGDITRTAPRSAPLALPLAPSFIQYGSCTQIGDPDLFYPPQGGGAAARRVCRGCGVRQECLEWALSQSEGDVHGIWGGVGARERRAIRKERAATVDGSQ